MKQIALQKIVLSIVCVFVCAIGRGSDFHRAPMTKDDVTDALALLQSPQWSKRLEAVRALGGAPEELLVSQVRVVAAALQDPSGAVQLTAAYLLIRVHSPQAIRDKAVDVIVQFIKEWQSDLYDGIHSRATSRRVALQTLPKAGPSATRALPALMPLLDGDKQLARQVAQCLAAIPTAESIAALLGQLKSADQYMRADVEQMFRRTVTPMDEASRAVLVDALASESQLVRELSAIALGRCGDLMTGQLSALFDMLLLESGDVAKRAVGALYQIQTPASIDTLFCLMEQHPDGLVRWHITSMLDSSLVNVARVDDVMVRLVLRSVTEERDGARAGVHRIVQSLGKENLSVPHLDALIELVKDAGPEQGAIAAFAIACMQDGAEPAIEVLIEQLSTTSGWKRDKCSEALQSIGEPAVMPLIAAMAGRHEYIEQKAPVLLSEIHSRTDSLEIKQVIEDALIKAAKDLEFDGSSHNVLSSLRRIGISTDALQ